MIIQSVSPNEQSCMPFPYKKCGSIALKSCGERVALCRVLGKHAKQLHCRVKGLTMGWPWLLVQLRGATLCQRNR
jgi:hypothetical protein